MARPRGKQHTTLTETAQIVVRELRNLPTIKMIAPGEIKTTKQRRSGNRHVTVVHTTAGCELIITGQSVQNVAIHTNNPTAVVATLKQTKALRDFTVKERSRLPGC